MSKRMIVPGTMDLSDWATVTFVEMSEVRSSVVKRRIAAVRLYFEGVPLKEIKRRTGIDRRKLHTILKRCLRAHRDGRRYGFRGCLMYARSGPYNRTAPSPAISKRARSGHSGLLRALLDRFPDIADKIVAAAFERTRGRFAESILRHDKLHRQFLKLCEDAGIKKNEYPFNVQCQGDRSFARWLTQELAVRSLRRALSATFGEEAAKRAKYLEEAVRRGTISLPFDLCEIDGYKLDTLMTIFVPAPGGGPPMKLVLERIWLIVVVDRVSRAVLGYHVSLSRNYSAEDVLICLENAIIPWRPRQLTIPELKYPENGGLPSGVIPELEYACWAKLAFDNAKANCSEWMWDQLTEKVGCVLSPGPVATPNTRSAIERLYREFASNFFQRLPTTTGDSLSDPRRRDPEEMAIRHEVHLDEILDLIDVVVAQYNATPTAGLYGRSPLEYLRFAIQQQSFFIRQVPETERPNFALAVVSMMVSVTGRKKVGESPYVRFLGVNYHSPKLSASRDMYRRKVILQCPSRDLRFVKIFLSSGEEFDVLTAEACWAVQAHDLRVRKAALACIRAGKIARRGMSDVIGAYMAYKRKQSYKRKKARNELAHAQRLAQATPVKAPLQAGSELAQLAQSRPTRPALKLRLRPFNF